MTNNQSPVETAQTRTPESADQLSEQELAQLEELKAEKEAQEAAATAKLQEIQEQKQAEDQEKLHSLRAELPQLANGSEQPVAEQSELKQNSADEQPELEQLKRID